jgi:hypothetical protein
MRPTNREKFQWGTVELKAEKEKAIAFGEAFEATPQNVQLTLCGAGDGSPEVHDLTKDGFKVKVPKDYNGKIMWLAIGKLDPKVAEAKAIEK